MEQICRICRSTTVTLIDIFGKRQDEIEHETSLSEMLNECVSCQINQEDLLPKKICLSCVLAAQNAFKFKRTCEQSHQHFCQLLKETLKDKEEADAEEDEEEDMCEDWPFANCGVKTESEEIVLAEETEPIDKVAAKKIDFVKNEDKIDIREEERLKKSTHETRFEKYSTESDSSEEPLAHIVDDTGSQPSSKKKGHLCDTCGMVFLRSAHLQRHARVHSGERPYGCPHCSKRFAQRSSLEDHIRLHKGSHPYKCDECPKKFNSRSNLQTHIRVHSGERPYKCPHCSKAFIQSGGLNTHLRVHTGERPYKCTQCPKIYSNNASLHNHSRIHSGERPFKCPHCPKTFPRKESLQNHIILHSGDRPYKCSHCPKDYCNRGGLVRHSRVHTRKV